MSYSFPRSTSSQGGQSQQVERTGMGPPTQYKIKSLAGSGNSTTSNFDIKRMRTAPDDIKQPTGAQQGILPEHPFRMYVVGASGSGKSNYVLNLLTRKDMYKNYFDDIFVISPTAAHLDPTYKALKLPKHHYFSPTKDGDPLNGDKVLKLMADIQARELKAVDYNKNEAKKILLILDDIVSFRKFTHGPMLLKFAVMSRHWNVSMMILSQAYHRIPKPVRMQQTCITFFKGSNKEIEVLTEDFMAPGMNKKSFAKMIHYATAERFKFFFIDLHRGLYDSRYRKTLTELLSVDDPRWFVGSQKSKKRKRPLSSTEEDEESDHHIMKNSSTLIDSRGVSLESLSSTIN